MRLSATRWREEKSAARAATLFSPRHEAPRLRQFAILIVAALALLGTPSSSRATSVIPIPDEELYRRADLIVYGVVVSSEAGEDPRGWPETVSVIRPVRVLKGSLGGDLVIHQAGGVLPDGRFFKLWGRPEYAPGHEVIVFAISRPEGDYQTAEMMLGKFEVEQDGSGRPFAVPDLARGHLSGVTIVHPAADGPRFQSGQSEMPSARFAATPSGPVALDALVSSPRDLAGFLDFLAAGASGPPEFSPAPQGSLEAVVHPLALPGMRPQWGNLNNSLWRYNNNATASWQLVGTVNMTGGGTTEATNALATWTNDPNSTINYTASASSTNQIQLSATSSPCGWSTCVDASGGVVGCGGPNGGGSNVWAGESYSTITGGTVWLRCYATANVFDSTYTQSFLTHELGHTLGLGHSDQNVSPHDVCRGDEDLAIMRSIAQDRTTLGTDDQDGIRWLYGDGGNHCTSGGSPPPTVTVISPAQGSTAGGTPITITGTNFQSGATVTLGGVAATAVTFVSSMTLTTSTPAHAAGSVDVVVTNPDTQNATLTSGFSYLAGSGYYSLAPCRVLDTRNANGPLGGPILAGGGATRVFVVAGACGIPAGAQAVSANITVTQPAAMGTFIMFPGNLTPSGTTAISFPAGVTRANNATLPLATDGSGSFVVANTAAGTAHLIVDINGYYQ